MFSKIAVVAGVAALVSAEPWDPKTGKTMNGQYTFGNTPKGMTPQHRGTNFFEVITPSYKSTYAEVRWDSFTVPLADDIVKELDGKLVNFVGYEFGMVETLPNGTVKPVPAWELYNHHYGNSILGKGTKLVKTGIPGDHENAEFGDDAERHFPGYKLVDAPARGSKKFAQNVRSEAAPFSNGGLIVGNGDESRKTFHYYGNGYGVLVASPNAAAIHPMMIDTKNREENSPSKERPTGHGVVPNASTVDRFEMYSPVHECPCTDKWEKKISSFSTLKSGSCNPDITSAETCWNAAAELGLHPVKANMTVSSPTQPVGCSVVATTGGYEIIFNTAKAGATCGEPGPKPPTGPVQKTACNFTGQWMQTSSKGAIYDFVSTGANKYNIESMGKVVATMTATAGTAAAPQGTVDGQWGKSAIPGVMNTYGAPGSPICSEIDWGNKVVFAKMPYAKNKVAPAVAPRIAGMAENLVNISVDIDSSKDVVTIVLQGPSDVWYGAGFGYHHVSTGGADPSVGVSMVGTNWTVIALADGTIMERDLGNHEAGVQLPNSVNVTSNEVVDGTRTVTMTRTIKGTKIDNYHFDPNANSLTFINAIGDTPYFMKHKAKSSGELYFVEIDYPTCICDVAADQGTIGGYSWGNQRCVGRPLGQMLDDPAWLVGPHANVVDGKGVNPSCDIHAYRGGLRCCKGGTIILDQDQNVTNNYVWEWQLKFRYYYEVVEDPTKVQNTFMTSWWTEHNNGEHDVPVCLEKDKSKCQNTISSNFTAGQFNGCANGCQMITMEGHCHIGCLGMELWIMDDPAKPELLCSSGITYGKGDGFMDEVGYIAGDNTCIFSDGTDGMAKPVLLHPETKLMSIKTSNNTNSYTGDMGLWEINAAPLPKGFKFPNQKSYIEDDRATV